MKTVWNLQLIYKNEKDPLIEKDLRIYENATEQFEKKYRTQAAYLVDEKKLQEALADYEKLFAMPEPRKAGSYFYYRKETNSADQEAERRLNVISDRLTKAGNKILFFDLALGKIELKLQEKFLKSEILKTVSIFLEADI
jgi:oligoendopeptidase F